MEIYHAPDILVICFKRFGSSGSYYRSKVSYLDVLGSAATLSLLLNRLPGHIQIDQNVDFPVENLNLEDRCDEMRLARTLQANGKDLEALGLQDATKPLLYDLCKNSRLSIPVSTLLILYHSQSRWISTTAPAVVGTIRPCVRTSKTGTGTSMTIAASTWRIYHQPRCVQLV